MSRMTRSFFATIGIIIVTIAYPLLVAGLLGDIFASWPAWLSIIVIAIFGALWCLPMAVLIKWMARPD